MDSELDDEIVEEIPVFLSKNIQDGLFILQFPTKNRVGMFDKAHVRNSFIKPLNQDVKMEVELDTMSDNFDKFRAEQLASGAGAKNKSDRLNNSTLLETQTYESSKFMDDASKYLVGVFNDKEVHLTPIKNILQMRPTFPHFDKEDKRVKANQNKMNSDEEEKNEELQQVTVKFSRPGTSKQKGKEKSDLTGFLKKREEESWRKANWYTPYSTTAETERLKLFSSTHEVSTALAMDKGKYAKKLLHNQSSNSGIDAVLPPRDISKNHLKNMSLIEQLKSLLKDAKMMNMEEIVSFLQQNVDSKLTYEKILRSLTQVGTLLHGNWILQSEYLYPKEAVSNFNGVCSELMANAREYVIYKFSCNSQLHRPDVITNTRLPPQEATEILNSIARLNSAKMWELLLPPDNQFEQRHPEIVERQQIIWRTIENKIKESEEKKSLRL